MLKTSTTHTSPDWAQKLTKRIKGLAGKEIACGFPVGSNAVTYPNGVSVVLVAAWNEFGTKHMPARPFLTQATDRMRTDASGKIQPVVKRAMREDLDPDSVLQHIALYAESTIRDTITNGDFVPNSARTVQRKKSDRPLIDTGKLRQSATAIVREAV